jgi:hypothetical protein
MDIQVSSFLIGGLVGVLTGLAALASIRSSSDQNRLMAATLTTDWLRDLRAWASEAVDVMAQATYTCASAATITAADMSDETRHCRQSLSSLIDRGRFLLPNEGTEQHGLYKPTAYRGFRHPVLDGLVAAEKILAGSMPLHSFPSREAALEGVRREFVSLVQSILNPRQMNKTIASLLEQVHKEEKLDPTLGGLLMEPEHAPPGDEGILFIASQRYSKGKALSR